MSSHISSIGETVEITLLRGDLGLGFNIRGGTDLPHIPGDYGIFVTKIKDGGAASVDGRLKEGDKITIVNGVSVVSVKHEEAVRLFRSSGERVVLTVVPQAEQKLVKAERERKVAEAGGSSSSLVPYVKWAVIAGIVALSLTFAVRKFKAPSAIKKPFGL